MEQLAAKPESDIDRVDQATLNDQLLLGVFSGDRCVNWNKVYSVSGLRSSFGVKELNWEQEKSMPLMHCS
ncbi:hypothetical protein TNCV_943831 [Trichonephila clavipes]|nr:hypothetical protein TNCV_943831 [Trichonephila clavipes]